MPAKKKAKKATKKTAKKKAGGKKKATKKAAPRKKATRSAARRTTKKAVRKAAPKKAAKKRAPNPAFMRPMNISAELGMVVGSSPMPRTEVTKRIWAYIRKNGLQDSVNRRMINADDNLKRVFGGKSKVSMFEMTKLVSKHLK